MNNIDKKCANTIRGLAADGIQKANSGHPGLPLGAADYAYVIWSELLKINPEKPNWINRDRFILSAGHGSMLLYSLLHLFGFGLTIEDLKQFRQWNSKTPGHPEFGHTVGVETTTGPLGQGISNAVGMAIAQKFVAEKLNKFGKKIIDNQIITIVGDGDLMEGISSEASSLAGHLKLDNMLVFYDDNNITIEGNTSLAFTEDVQKRYEAYGWEVLRINGHNYEEIRGAIKTMSEVSGKPRMIICKTTIGCGAPNKKNTSGVHGSPLGDEELKLCKIEIGLPSDKSFYVSDEVKQKFEELKKEKVDNYNNWKKEFDELYNNNSEFKKLYDSFNDFKITDEIKDKVINLFSEEDGIATRAAGGKVLNCLADLVPGLIGGSADLAPSTKTFLNNYSSFQAGSYDGRNLHFGIREHAMAAITNGIALYGQGWLIPYDSTFHVFTDYCRPSLRLAALMKLKTLHIMTHDSIFVGEDGPTHQPVEQTMACRLIPELLVYRPADSVETAAAFISALDQEKKSSVIVLTRQNLPVMNIGKKVLDGVSKGAYIVYETEAKEIDLIIIATGSEVHISVEAAKELEQQNIGVRVISMCCEKIFALQNSEYKEKILPKTIKKRISVEAGVTAGWEKYVGLDGISIGIDHYGASAPYKKLAEEFGFSTKNIVEKAKELF